jgi:5-(carboxyamino)imidazole ribonucleotide synthase
MDVVTFEFENVSAEALALLERSTRVAPPRRALEVTQNRLREKRFLDGIPLATAPYAAVENAPALKTAMASLAERGETGPYFLKIASHGYDGKGQLRIAGPEELARAEEWLGNNSAVLEASVRFEMELSIIAVRDAQGAMAFYDLPQNAHSGGILRESNIPAPIPSMVRYEAEYYARAIAEGLDYVGVIAVEMFLEKQGEEYRLLVNEVAPRVHNSGHWTAEACAVSQFENHIRAVAGWPLGSTARHSDARMVNLLGDEIAEAVPLMRENPSRSVHVYGKREARAGRKMGHYVELSPMQER